MVLAERYVVGSKAMGKVDYSIELGNGEILGITEDKKDDYFLGIAQNAIQIRSAVEYNKLISINHVLELQLMQIGGIFCSTPQDKHT